MSFIWQSAPDIGRKLERLKDLKSKTLGDLVREAEKIFNKQKTPEETEEKKKRRRAEDEQKKKKKKKGTAEDIER